jgi:hypothetical protein
MNQVIVKAFRVYLVNSKIISDYIELKGKHRDLYKNTPDQLRDRVKAVGRSLVRQYNEDIRSSH